MISVVINTYNAERHLAECLEAVKDFDEIVVCDMESTDRTVEIAQRYGCKIVTYPKGDCVSAEPARTFAIQSASSEWVLVVDSMSQTTISSKSLTARLNKIFGVYNRGWSNDYQLRFFIREGTEWPPYVHTFPKVNGRVEKAPRQYKMLHLADETTVQLIAKMNQYTDSEVDKKADRGFGVVALFTRPLFRFIASFFFRGGFRNGKRGLLGAIQEVIYQLVLVSKIIEKKLREQA